MSVCPTRFLLSALSTIRRAGTFYQILAVIRQRKTSFILHDDVTVVLESTTQMHGHPPHVFSSYGTDLISQTFVNRDNESRVMNSSTLSLSDTSIALSEKDEIRAGSMILSVLVLRRPEPQTSAWTRYVNNVDTFLRQCDRKDPVRRNKESGVPTVLESTTLGSLGSAEKVSCAQVYKMIDTRGRLYVVKVPLHKGLNSIIERELDWVRVNEINSTQLDCIWTSSMLLDTGKALYEMLRLPFIPSEHRTDTLA